MYDLLEYIVFTKLLNDSLIFIVKNLENVKDILEKLLNLSFAKIWEAYVIKVEHFVLKYFTVQHDNLL